MPTTADDCTCEKQCPGESECACIYVYDEGRCIVDCPGVIVIHPSQVLPREARIALNSRGVRRARLAEFLSALCRDEILIPASVASERLELAIYDTALGDALQQAGLVVREREGKPA
jgi:hypothetical protein